LAGNVLLNSRTIVSKWEDKPDLTVAICAYNAEKRIGMVLESLARQVVPQDIRWELLVIDNASKDETSRLVSEMGERLGLPLRLLSESQPGLANARRLAALEAKAEVLSFLDDDTVTDENWVIACVEFMHEHPDAGIVGAKVEPLFENEACMPADFATRFASILSMIDLGDISRRLKFPEDPNPVGAGMTGRTSLFRLIFDEFRTVNVGRIGSSLSGGEDLEAVFIADRMGWEVWYAPSLRLRHFVPNNRVTDDYWDRWMIQTAPCQAWLLALNGREVVGRRWHYATRYLRLEMLGLKYAVLNLLPAGLHPKLARSRFWRRYYRAMASGYRHLAANGQATRRIFELIERNRRPRRSPEGATCL
jgi:glycosyltransferase involved in cell wall biosynthesis